MKRPPPTDAPATFNNPFASLEKLRADLPAGEKAAPPRPNPAEKPAPARAVVRLERKGRGGREATVVEKLELPRAELERWLHEAKHSLGCGGSIDEGALVIQGDQRERLRAWLQARGVRKISVG